MKKTLSRALGVAACVLLLVSCAPESDSPLFSPFAGVYVGHTSCTRDGHTQVEENGSVEVNNIGTLYSFKFSHNMPPILHQDFGEQTDKNNLEQTFGAGNYIRIKQKRYLNIAFRDRSRKISWGANCEKR